MTTHRYARNETKMRKIKETKIFKVKIPRIIGIFYFSLYLLNSKLLEIKLLKASKNKVMDLERKK